MSDRNAAMQDVVIRPPLGIELSEASALCLRSKAHWGYDSDFIKACRDELTLTERDLAEGDVATAFLGEAMIGVAQVSADGDQAELDKLFIEPDLMGHGIGRLLFEWASDRAKELGANRMVVTADPDAVPFYEKMGFRRIGKEPSGSIPDRILPVLAMKL